MLIDKKDIERIKQSHDLKALVESYGVRLKKKGTNFVGLCPFHKEKTPSFTVNPKTQLWHCFGCDAGGDVISFVAKREGLSFRDAYNKLSGMAPGINPKSESLDSARDGYRNPKQTPACAEVSAGRQNSKSETVNAPGRTRLLNRVISFYHQTLFEDQRGL